MVTGLTFCVFWSGAVVAEVFVGLGVVVVFSCDGFGVSVGFTVWLG